MVLFNRLRLVSVHLQAHLLGTLAGHVKERDLSPTFGMEGRLEYWKSQLMRQNLGWTTLSQLNLVRETLRSLQIPYLSYYPLTSLEAGQKNGPLCQEIMIDRPWGRNRRVGPIPPSSFWHSPPLRAPDPPSSLPTLHPMLSYSRFLSERRKAGQRVGSTDKSGLARRRVILMSRVLLNL